MKKKISPLFFVLLLFGCTVSPQQAKISEIFKEEKPRPAKVKKAGKVPSLERIHTKCRSCHNDPDKGLFYPFIKTKSDRLNPHTKKPFSRVEAICTSCHDFFHYVHPDGVPAKSDRVVLPENVRLDKGKINCLTCHDMHQKEPSYKNLYPAIGSKNQLKDFCNNCHTQPDRLQDDIYYMLTELKIMAMKEQNIFFDKSEDGWFVKGPSFIKRFYESITGETLSEKDQVEESFKVRKNASMALEAIAAEDLSEAIHLLWTAFRKDRDFALGYTRLARGYDSIGKMDEAEIIYLHALKHDKTYAPAYLGQGRILFRREKYWEAIDRYSKAVRYDPGMSDAYFEMGDCYLLVKNYPEGIRAFKEALNLVPKNLDGHLKLARMYQIRNDHYKAIGVLSDALIFYPEHSELHFELGNVYYAQYDLTRAIVSYEKTLKLNPDNFDAYIRLGRSYEMVQDTVQAIRNYDNAVMTDRYRIEGYLYLSRLYRKLNKIQKAEEASIAALQIQPDSIEVRLALGNAYYQDQRYLQAEKEYKKVLSINPDHKEANLRLGMLYHQSGRNDMAITVLQKMVEGKSTQTQVYLLLGECLKNNIDDAMQIYKKGVRYCTDKAVLYFNLGYLYWQKLHRPDQARVAYKAALAAYPAYAKAYFYMGRLAKDENDIPQAISFLEKAIELDPSRIDVYLLLAELNKEKYSIIAQDKILNRDPVEHSEASQVPHARYELINTEEEEKVYYKLGTIYMANGKWENAANMFNRVLKSNPANSKALGNLVITYRAQNRLDTALEKLSRLSKLHPEISEIHVEIGNIHKYGGQKRQAFQSYLTARDLAPEGSDSKNVERLQALKIDKKKLLAEGNTHYYNQKYFMAERKYKAILSLDPYNAEANLHLWLLYADSNRNDMAMDILRKMVEEKSSRAEFYLLLGERVESDDAVEIYRQGVKYSDKKAVLYFNLGYLYWKELRDIESAREAFEKAITVYPAYAKAYLFLGRILKEENNIAWAVRSLEKSITLDPNRIDAYLLLVELGREEYFGRLFHDIVLAEFDKISYVPNAKYELDFKDSKYKEEFYYKLGTIYMANGKWANAAEALGRVLKWNPSHSEVMTKIIIAYKAQGKYQKALKTLFKLMKIRPEDPKIFFEIGNAYKKMGQSESAWENYLKAREIADEGSQMVGTLDLALADTSYDIWHKRKGMKLLAKAKTYNAKALETYPGYLVISRRLEEIEKLLRGQIQILKVETRSRRKYQEIVKQIRKKSSLADLRHIVKQYPKWTQIRYIYPHKLNDELRSALDLLKDGKISQVIQRKRKYIGIYRVTSANGGKNR